MTWKWNEHGIPTEYLKPLAKLSNKVGLKAPTLLDPTLFDSLAAHVGRCSSNIFCSIKCWIEFAFDQTLQPTILFDAAMLQCVLPLFQQSCVLTRVTFVLLANHESLSYFQAKASSIVCNRDGGQGARGRRGC